MCSQRAWPIPWASPPWICPSTSNGLMTRPQSTTATTRRRRTAPDSRSTSTTATCVPEGKVKFGGSHTVVASSPGSMDAGSALTDQAAAATSASVVARSGTPRTTNRSRSTTMSSAPASRSAAAIRRALSSTLSTDATRAGAPTAMERLPNVPTPAATMAVSPWRTDIVHRNPQAVGDDLGKGRFEPLAMRARACEHGDLARRLDPHGGALPAGDGCGLGRADARGLHEGREADPEVAPVVARAALEVAKALVVDHRQRPVERRLVLARVVDEARRGAVRELLGADQVAPTDLGRVEAARARDGVHSPLEQVRRLRPPGAAIGGGGHRVGEDAGELVARGRNEIGPGEEPPGEDAGVRREDFEIGAEVRDGASAERQHGAVPGDRRFDVVDLAAPLRGREEIFAAREDELDRSPRAHSRPRAEGLVGI